MTYPDHQLFQISGTLGPVASPYEIWSTGIRTVASIDGGSGGSNPVVLTLEELQSYLDTVEPLFLAAAANSALNVSGGSVKINLLKYNQMDANGHYLYDQTVQAEIENAPFGSGATTASLPTQIAKVLTLETGFTRGLAHRGRMYIPTPTNTFNSTTGTFNLAQAELDAWAALVDVFNQTLTRGSDTITVQAAVVSGVGTGFGWRPVTGVSMDSRADVQRRRANDIQGTRLAADLP